MTNNMKKKRTVFYIIASVLICLAVGALSGIPTSGAVPGWYATLNKPAFNPPDWIFGPVWSLLYILMGIAAGLIWSRGIQEKEVKGALAIFILQLLLNGLWSLIFFGLHSPLFALFDIMILWVFILLCMIRFLRIRRTAAYLLVPYQLWVSFAAVLNLFILILN